MRYNAKLYIHVVREGELVILVNTFAISKC